MNYPDFDNMDNNDIDSQEKENQITEQDESSAAGESAGSSNAEYSAIAGLEEPDHEHGSSPEGMDFGGPIRTSYYTENYTKPKRTKRGPLFQMIALSLVSSILGGAVVGGYFQFAAPRLTASAVQEYGSQQSGNGDSSQVSKISIETSSSAVSAVAEKVGPSIIGIKTTYSSRGIFGVQESGGEGSGIIYSSDGYIVTNYHVIEGAVDTSSKSVAQGAKIQVVLPKETDKPYDAQVVGYDSKTDLAVIKIQASNLPAVEFGDSDSVKVGEMAVAIGNPGGLEYMGSVTQGIISGINRTIESEAGKQLKLIQTDAAINPGNSGGALVNSSGQVIGINSVKIAATGYEGLGFAIPSNTVKDIAENLINYKYVKGRTALGISIDQRFNEEIAAQNNVPAGIYVQDVALFSGAYKAGIKAGDIITKFDGQTVKSYDDLNNLKSTHKPGDVVSVELYREGQTLTVQITLDEDKNN